jgi:LysR family transcriptional activator of nhaA
MEWLNYHHLLYFWAVAKEGSVTRACEKLHLAQPTISGQLRLLERSLGEKLFVKAGRGLALTETGRLVYRYAEEIFGLGRELQSALRGSPKGLPVRLHVGVSDSVPKLIAFRLMRPAMEMAEPVHLICHEANTERLLARLAEHELDVVLADAPAPPGGRVRIFNHLLGSCGVTLLAAPALARKHRERFPASLDGAPVLLPMEGSELRRALEQWFESEGIRPRAVGEFQDSALLKAFGQAGAGIFAAPSAIEQEVREHYRVAVVGRPERVTERFYAISAERRLRHPAVVAISESARHGLFAPGALPESASPAGAGLETGIRAQAAKRNGNAKVGAR